MEQKILSKSSMVSRLPKFGSRPSGTTSPLPNGISSPLPNDTTQTVSIQEIKSPQSRANGVVRTSSFKWMKENGRLVDPSSPVESHLPEDKKDVRSPRSPGNRQLKSPSTCSTKIRKSAPSVCSGSSKVLRKSPNSIPSPKPKPKTSQITTITDSQNITQKTSDSKLTQNGTSSMGSSPGRAVSSGLQRPRVNSGSQPSSSRDSLSQSNDSLSQQSIVPDSIVRSQSFTHFKQLPSPTNIPMTRSFSFNKAVELAKPLVNTQLRPPRMLGLKTPQNFSKGRLVLGLGGLGFKKKLSDQLPVATSPSDNLTPLNAIKRPLLPNSVLTKPSLRPLQRPIAAKPQLVVGRTPVENDSIIPTLSPDMPNCAIESVSTPTGSPEEPSTEQELDGNLRYSGEGPEDMSLSSASSLERNDTSEEFLDDFDNLGDQSQKGIVHNRSSGATSTQTRLQSFLTETMDWDGIGQRDGKADPRAGPPCGPPVISTEVDHHAVSSLELSPSNSSGGTYMWDEEGMEPLGHNTRIPRCNSYESDLNSIDILNNLDNTESCDLEEDDLMLDVDLPEDEILRSDGMAHFERSERGGRPAQWRRRQQRWSGTDHSHNDNRVSGLHYEGCRSTPRPLRPAVQLDGHAVALDTLVLKHMTEDCNSVKSQLLKLKSLLQMDDGEITPESLETSEDDSKAQQMEQLMKEVTSLREELKNKDQIISRLTRQQLQQESPVRCQSHQQKCGVKSERRSQHDKSTQTTWRPPHHHHAPTILQPISHIPNDTLIQGRLARTVHTGDHNDARFAGVGSAASCSPSPCTSVVVSPAASSTEVPHTKSGSTHDPEVLSQLLSTHLCIQDNCETDSQLNGDRIVSASLYNQPNKLLQTSHPKSFFIPRVLQPPRLYRQVTLPTLPLGGSCRANPKPGPTMSLNAKQFPPPTRGLPCASFGRTIGVFGKTEPVPSKGVSD